MAREKTDLDKAIEEEQKECKRGNPDSFWAKWLDWFKQQRSL